MKNFVAVTLSCLAILAQIGCNKPQASTSAGPQKVQLTLDWHPEPEFGGFYAAAGDSTFARHNLAVDLKMAGEGAPIWQLVATGKTEFGTTAADQVLIAREQGADVVAIFTVYQISPQGVMVHKARGFTSLADVFTHPGNLEAEDLSWLHFCTKKFGTKDVKLIANEDGIATFLAKPDTSQQCFVTSEPILAAAQHSDPQTFLIADSGFNPYTTVVITTGDMVRKNPALVKNMVTACREGWRSYLDNPAPANTTMRALNQDMDPQTFIAAAAAQKPLIETDETKATALGTMTADRWNALSRQLMDLGVIKAQIPAKDCFVDVDQLR